MPLVVQDISASLKNLHLATKPAMPRLTAARYGKDNVRVYKVHRDQETGVQTVTEMTVCCLLEGEIDSSYTDADNSVVVATDTIKNTIYITAKENPVNPPELYASILGSHFLEKYAHISVANVSVKVHRWTRLSVNGAPHPHSFVRDSDETRNVEAVVRHDGISIKSSITGLTVLKSTGSAFHGYVQDEFTTLAETWDRILSTDVDCGWRWASFADLAAVKADLPRFDKAWEDARTITTTTFATDASASVQNTMYKMSEQILEAAPGVATVTYSLPNKHYFEIDLSWYKDTKNTGKDAEVYAPQSGPNGLIKCEVSR
ncbi:uricase [Ophiostoma piceae UAMH 11346]|uniref:Uricase n=1 Tax=Ophiostoma piceae (strain UAMH 11346) TaxID=1262450 RepID=S3CW89_OPHP1|nr:uricase [Ophiostoma piceae UAMH 11346]